MAKTSAYGTMASGFAIGQKIAKDYSGELTEIASKSFDKIIAGEAEKNAVLQKKFDNIMQTFNEASMIPTVTAEERTQIQPVVDAVSTEAQNFALAMIDNPKDLDAQAGYNQSIAKLNRVTQAQTEKYKYNEQAQKVYYTNSYSAGQDPTKLSHAKEIVANNAKRTFDNDGYETYVMEDGTTYDNNPNTNFPKPPRVEGEYKEGHTAILKNWNLNVTDSDDMSKTTKKLNTYNVDGGANTIYSDIMTSGPEGSAPSYEQKMDLLFGDISGDGQEMSFADMFINGKLDDKYYTSLNAKLSSGSKFKGAKELEYNGIPISQYPTAEEANKPFSMTQTDKPAEKVVTREQALEAILRDEAANDANLRNFSRFYSSTIKTGLENQKLDQGMSEGLVILGNDPNFNPGKGQAKKGATIRGDKFFNNRTEANQAKKELYTEMAIEKALFMDLNDPNGQSNEMASIFTSSKEPIELAEDGDGNTLYIVGDPESANAKYYDPKIPAELEAFKKYLRQNSKGMFTDLGTLSGDPNTWTDVHYDENMYNTGYESDVDNANNIDKETVDVNQETSNNQNNNQIAENNTQQTSGSSFNIDSTPINQGFNFNSAT